MLEGICILSVIPMRKNQSDSSEMINQVLFGETFKIIKENQKWSYVKLNHDQYTGWIDNKQYQKINIKSNFIPSHKNYVNIKINNIKQILILGSLIPLNQTFSTNLKLSHSLSFLKMKPMKIQFTKIAKKYLNTPYMWGGRTPLGIDCSGYTQMVFRFFNIQLPRDSFQQAKVGQEININDTKLGDLAFFGTRNKITHVGIMLKKNKIIHASGKVRIDQIDEQGIFNQELNSYTHDIKLIRRVISL
tara:strand:- start:1284 stop:2021 length:738 start_codon:yes stop_codon:yes gene_type:complete